MIFTVQCLAAFVHSLNEAVKVVAQAAVHLISNLLSPVHEVELD
jgi:hypothetical protein